MALRGAALTLGALCAVGVCASTASAAPLSMTFTEARANVGKQLSDDPLFAAPETAPFSAQIDPLTGAISNGTLGVPDFETHIEHPIVADVTVEFHIGQITGSFNEATGALSLTGEAGGILTASGNATYEGEQCTVLAEASPITLTTAGSSGGANPRSGMPFVSGLSGSGAIAGEWEDMSAEPVEPVAKDETFCEDVEGQIGGTGGVWLEQKDLTPPPAPQLVSTIPASPDLSGTPRILGSAERGSTVRIYPGPVCAGAGTPVAPGVAGATGGSGTAAELASPGIAVGVPEGTTAIFSATATDAAGNTSPCSGSISYTRLHANPVVVACIVPNLIGKKLGRAKVALRAAHCTVGKVRKPRHRRGRKLGPLVVKSSNPAAGTDLAADSPVGVRLGHKHHKAHRS